jgi:thioredoxin-related protein
MRKYLLAVVIFSTVFTTTSFAQQPDAEGSLVHWITLQEALEKNKTQPKPIILDFYTDWCGWCKHMMKTTYADPGLAQYINTYFYAAKFNAEGKDTIDYLGKKYAPSSTAPKAPHELAIKLLQGKLMYPTTLFLNNFEKDKNEFKLSMLASGFLDKQKIEPILVFTLENVFRNCAYDDFGDNFNKAFYDTATLTEMKKLSWKTPKEIFDNATTSKKKTLVMIHTDWCNSCKVMYRTSFIDSTVFPYLKDKYNLVDFNPELTDSIAFKGQTFTNPRTQQYPFHQLALALSKNNFMLPTIALLDENMNLIDAIPSYIPPEFLNDIVRYYGDDLFKTKSWKEFQDAKKK